MTIKNIDQVIGKQILNDTPHLTEVNFIYNLLMNLKYSEHILYIYEQ